MITACQICFYKQPITIRLETSQGHVTTDAGDNAGAAGSVAADVGLATADVHAELLPEEKLDMVRCPS